jgi:hypothetical protein
MSGSSISLVISIGSISDTSFSDIIPVSFKTTNCSQILRSSRMLPSQEYFKNSLLALED